MRTVFLSVAAGIAFLAMQLNTVEAKPMKFYDANCDGVVNLLDSMDIRNEVAGFGPTCRGDVDGDGAVTAVDALHVLRKIAGLE